MKALIWLGGFVTGAALMLAVILWVLSDTEDFATKRFPWPTS